MKPSVSIHVILTFIVLTQTDSFTDAAPPRELRAIWVTRSDFKHPDDIKRIMTNAAATHFNMVLFQVRGNATVYYKSKIEPWAWELTGPSPDSLGKDPDWDPLEVAVREAHARGLELHAWVNVFPAWRSQTYPPKSSHQLWWSHPEWFMCDAAGQRMVPRDHKVEPEHEDWYAFLSPGIPQVQDYLVGVFEEIVRNYKVDGIHYDYVRYPGEVREVDKSAEDRAKKLGNWSYDPVSLARFTQQTHIKKPDENPEAWTRWRCEQVTTTVRKIAERVRPLHPQLRITASVFPVPELARQSKYQDYVTWLNAGTVDAVFTMDYTDDTPLFQKHAQSLLDKHPKGLIATGISLSSKPEAVRQQIALERMLHFNGFAGFSYDQLFNRADKHRPRALVQILVAGTLAGRAELPWASPATKPSN